MSAAWPVRCTGMAAFVRGVIAFSISPGTMFIVSSSTSANTGRAPSIATAEAEAIKEFGAVITSSPGPTLRARSARLRAAVPLETPTAKRASQ